MSWSCVSYAKINLYLAVLGERPDGYHEVDTVLQSVSLCDRIDFEPLVEPLLRVTCAARGVPSGRENLVWKALSLLRERHEGTGGMRVAIHKRIPPRAGLGGGSSNAACALCAGNRIWGLGLSDVDLEQLGAELGSDVPFFIRGGTQQCLGRGEKLRHLTEIPDSLWVIVKADNELATAAVYAGFRTRLTERTCKPSMLLGALAKRDLSGVVEGLFNDLEDTAVELQPEVAKVKVWMGQLGLGGVVLAGSGSAWVGQCPDSRMAALIEREGRARGWHVYLVEPTRRGWSEAKNGIQ